MASESREEKVHVAGADLTFIKGGKGKPSWSCTRNWAIRDGSNGTPNWRAITKC